MPARRPSGARPEAQAQVHIPKVNADLVWSLKPWPASLTVAGQEWEIPALPAADWVAALLAGDVLDMMDALLEPEDAEDFLAQASRGEFELADLEDLSLELVRVVGARPWWVTLRLLAIAQANWDSLGARMLLKGVDAGRLSLSGWLDVLLLVTLEAMDPKDTMMFSMRLEQPPPEEAEAVAEDLEMSRDAFLSLG